LRYCDFIEPFPNAGFLIARYPVTNHQFKRFVDAGGYGEKTGKRPEWWSKQGRDYRKQYDWTEPRWWDDARFNRPTRPVVSVSWYEAEAYCNWLNGPGSPYKQAAGSAQLPSIAQWEAAARSGRPAPGNKQQEERDYPWAGKFDPALANTAESSLQQTTPVDMYLDGKTQACIFDLAGNVWEWTNDMERTDWYFIKGGSWATGAEKARAGLRSAGGGGSFWSDLRGFRAVVVPNLSCAPSGC
jgi:formylglycine-generating enzyme required for sulfatase activity